MPTTKFNCTLLATAVAAMVFSAASTTAANLVTNGDFSTNAGDFGTFPGNTGLAGNPAAIDDWTKFFVSGANLNVGINGPDTGFFPSEPFAPSSTAGVDNFAFLQRGGTSTGGLLQTVTLQPNTKYKITWDAANRAGAGNLNALGRVEIGDNSNVYYSSGDTTWTQSSFTSYSGTFKTGSSFDGSSTVRLYNLTPAVEGNDKTVAYTNITIEVTNEVALPTIANANFETLAGQFVSAPGYVGGSNPAEIFGWTGTGDRGINPGNGAGTAFRNNGNNNTNVAFTQGPASLSQNIDRFEVGKEYRIAFDYNSRAITGNATNLTATIGTATLTDSFVAPVGGSNSYYKGNLVFTPSNATETLAISQTDSSGNSSLLLDNFRIFRNGPSIADNGFENPVQPANNWKQANGGGGGSLAGAAWTITGGAGITRNFGAFHPGLPAPEGDQFGLLQDVGSFSQTVSGFEIGAEYSLSLLTMRRNSGPALGNNLQILLDAGLGSELGLIDINEVTFSSFSEVESLSFVASKTVYDLTIRGTNPLGGDRTTFVDNVWFNQLTEAPAVIPEPTALLLLAIGMLGVIGFIRHNRARYN